MKGAWIIAGAIVVAAALVAGTLLYHDNRREGEERCEQLAAVIPQAAGASGSERRFGPEAAELRRLVDEFRELDPPTRS